MLAIYNVYLFTMYLHYSCYDNYSKKYKIILCNKYHSKRNIYFSLKFK